MLEPGRKALSKAVVTTVRARTRVEKPCWREPGAQTTICACKIQAPQRMTVGRRAQSPREGSGQRKAVALGQADSAVASWGGRLMPAEAENVLTARRGVQRLWKSGS